MPTASGLFQPTNQHPVPVYQHHHAGAELVLKTLQPGENLLIPAPPNDGVRTLIDQFANIWLEIIGPGTDITDLKVYFKDKQGRKYIVFQDPGPIPAPPAPGVFGNFINAPLSTLYADNSWFTGLYLSYSGGVGATFTWRQNYWDTQNVFPFLDTEVDYAGPNQGRILSPTAAPGVAAVMAQHWQVPVPSFYIFNFDDIPHDYLLALVSSDDPNAVGTIISSVTTVDAAVVPGQEASGAFNVNQDQNVSVPAGYAVLLFLAEPLNGGGPVIATQGYIGTNLAPVREDQGGAY